MHSQNYKLTPAPSEIASQFPPPRTFEQIPKIGSGKKVLEEHSVFQIVT
jgi:hypothetical protein